MAETSRGRMKKLFLALGVIAALAAAGCDDIKVKPNTKSASGRFGPNQPARIVLGQASFTANVTPTVGSPSPTNLGGLVHSVAAGDSNILYVVDGTSLQFRVLGFPKPLSTTFPIAATYALGVANTASTNAAFVATPPIPNNDFVSEAVATDGNQFFIQDQQYVRIAVYNSMPAGNHLAPNFVLIAPNPTTAGTLGCTPTTPVNAFDSISAGSGKLVMVDRFGHRLFVYNLPIAADGAAPALILGQSFDGTNALCQTNNGPPNTPNQQGFDLPVAVWTDGHRMAVADYNNSRVLLWSTFPTAVTSYPDVVLGHMTFTSTAVDVSDQGRFSQPVGVASDGNQLFVADQNFHRVLVWDKWPTQNGQLADQVIGQPDFVARTTAPAISDHTLNTPNGVSIVGTDVIVDDSLNHRVLIW